MGKSQKRNLLRPHRNCEKYIEIQGFPELAEDALEILGRNIHTWAFVFSRHLLNVTVL